MVKALKISSNSKGFLFALFATIAFSNVYIFSKAALNEISLAQFGLYWFAFGLFYNFLFSLKTKALKKLKEIKLKEYRVLLYLWLLESITTASFFVSIKIIPDPAVTSFLGNLYMVFLVILGILMLKEKFTLFESIGVLITIAGAFIVGYQGGKSLIDFFIPGTGIVVLNCFMAAYTSIVAKKTLRKFSPAIINLNRTFSLFLFSFIYFLISKDSFLIPVTALKNIAIGSLLGPFAGLLCIYYSFKYIEASRSSVIQGLKGVFVLVGSYLYFRTFPQAIQVIGGIISVIGIMIMTFSKAKLLSWKSIKLK